MTTGEDQFEPFIGVFFRIGQWDWVGQGWLMLSLQCRQLAGKGLLAAQAVNQLVAGGGRDPCGRLIGNTFGGPAFKGDGKGILQGFFGKFEIFANAKQGGQYAPTRATKGLLDGNMDLFYQHMVTLGYRIKLGCDDGCPLYRPECVAARPFTIGQKNSTNVLFLSTQKQTLVLVNQRSRIVQRDAA